MKKIAILGSTGSIGTQTLDIVRNHEDYVVVAMSAGKNVELFYEQILEFQPKVVSVWDENDAIEIKRRLSDSDIEVYSGMDGLIKVATVEESEILVTAIVGMVGLKPTVEAMKAGKDIALANKETLVTAGHIIMPLAKEKGVRILPVDSEHSAIFQSLQGNEQNAIKHIWLTASGGPFRGKNIQDLEKVEVEDALKHPNWSMGKKITIDSATMINKGLEVMEAKWLFDVDLEQIKVLVHPQSVIHSMVEYEDGGVMAQLGTPDMRLPIQYALTYPDREYLPGKRLDFYELGSMTFEKPDMETFYGLRLAYEAMEKGGNVPTIFNAANEMAVALFLNKRIRFLDIPAIIEDCMNNMDYINHPSVDEIIQTQKKVDEYIKGRWCK